MTENGRIFTLDEFTGKVEEFAAKQGVTGDGLEKLILNLRISITAKLVCERREGRTDNRVDKKEATEILKFLCLVGFCEGISFWAIEIFLNKLFGEETPVSSETPTD